MIRTRARRRLASEQGFALMEVVTSAAVLVLVVLGILAGLDAVAGTAGANKARTVAATLAEKDQELLRSLMTADLQRIETVIPAPRKVKVDGVEYTVTSDARLITDVGGKDISCALASGEGAYVRITSTVTSPLTGDRVKPVVISSIVAPEPGSGTLVAKVTNANAQGVVGMPVQAIGPENKTKVTNEAGCAVFGAVKAGRYEVKVSQLGWVNSEGEQEVIKSATVSAGQLTTVDFVYDVGATVTVTSIRTRYGSPIADVNDDSYGIVAAHTGILTGYRVFPDATPTLSTTHTLQGLFPFKDPYKIYSGRCTGADPTGFDANYFDTYLAAAPTLEPGQGVAITIYEPAMNVKVTWNGSTTGLDSSSARVYAYPRTEGCDEGLMTRFDLGRTRAGGRADRPGLPFGTYDLCAQYVNSTDGRTYEAHLPGVTNGNADGTATQNINIPFQFGARGSCGSTAP